MGSQKILNIVFPKQVLDKIIPRYSSLSRLNIFHNFFIRMKVYSRGLDDIEQT
jgi:hypothetical protein